MIQALLHLYGGTQNNLALLHSYGGTQNNLGVRIKIPKKNQNGQ